jgi:hypothetical protein
MASASLADSARHDRRRTPGSKSSLIFDASDARSDLRLDGARSDLIETLSLRDDDDDAS